ncbi:MAG: AarF/UbiB family protein [Gemmatimonadota bacterium]|nr:AarF/UbiB family protein [Gemmatimonadota bacterium]
MLLSPRYLPRLAALVGLFTRYGLRDFARSQGLQALAPDETDTGNESSDVAGRARGFRDRLVELGPAYVKLGQVLSTRPDLLPDSYIRELAELQDAVDPLPFEQVEATIQEELGARLSKLFVQFERQPLGSASLGQVHAAELRGDRAVVVKVQRPGIREQLADDVAFFREVAAFMTSHTEAGNRVDLAGVIQQLERALVDELDYRTEARNSAAFRRALAGFPRILVPKVVEAYSTSRVLTTERVKGVKIDEVPRITRTEHDFAALADEFAKAYLHQITIVGHFHADPHPGNVFIILPGSQNPLTPAEIADDDRRTESRPALTAISRMEQEAQADAPRVPADIDVKLALIDFGMTARLSDALRERVVRLLLDLSENRGESAAELMVELSEQVAGFDRPSYERQIAALVARNHDRSVGELQAGTVMYELINISYQHGLKLPPELTLLAKALFNLDAVSRALDPTYNPLDAIREYGGRIAQHRARRELSPSRMFKAATETSDLLHELPHRLDVITRRLAANEIVLNIDTPGMPVLLQGLQKIANRIFSGLVICGLLVASAMLMPYRRVLGTTGFVIAGVLALYLVVTILFSDRKKR